MNNKQIEKLERIRKKISELNSEIAKYRDSRYLLSHERNSDENFNFWNCYLRLETNKTKEKMLLNCIDKN